MSSDNPILNSPYDEPKLHYATDADGSLNYNDIRNGRRIFSTDIQGSNQTTSLGNFEVTKARIHDDLLQEGLKKKPAKSAASFVTIGEPDIAIHKKGNSVTVEIQGLDIYDPIKDEVKARNVNDIAYWMVDDDYDGSSFVVKQVFFCGGESTEFDKWKKGLSEAAKQDTKKKAEKTLKIEIDDEAFDRLYGHISHPIEVSKKRAENSGKDYFTVWGRSNQSFSSVINLTPIKMARVKQLCIENFKVANLNKL